MDVAKAKDFAKEGLIKIRGRNLDDGALLRGVIDGLAIDGVKELKGEKGLTGSGLKSRARGDKLDGGEFVAEDGIEAEEAKSGVGSSRLVRRKSGISGGSQGSFVSKSGSFNVSLELLSSE